MRYLHQSVFKGVVMSALLLPCVTWAGPVNNILLQWRAQADACEDPNVFDDLTVMQVAMFEAINTIEGKYTSFGEPIQAAAGSSALAAGATAAHDVLLAVCPDEQGAIDGLLKRLLAGVSDEKSREGGAEVGRRAAAAVLASRATSGADARDPFPAATVAGVYVSTMRRAGQTTASATPWIMQRPEELRVGPPPALNTDAWARDFGEIKRLGGKRNSERTPEQTDTAKFWAGRDVRLVLRQLIGRHGRSLVDDARFLALADMAWSDSYVAMMDGKYHYNFWRPVTAVRQAAEDGNAATTPDAKWEPLINTPWHPEYPCGHCLSAAAVGTVIALEFGDQMPTIVLEQEDTLLRRFETAQEYIDDVTESRLLAGVHYRFSLNAGRDSGVQLGTLAAQRYFKPVSGK